VFGELKIVPTVEVGQVIPNVVETTIYNWKWYYTAQGFAVWLVLIPTLVLPKSNRDLRALLIFVPLLVVNRLGAPLIGGFGMISIRAVQLDTLMQSMAAGMAVLWLTADSIMRYAGRIRFLASLGTVSLVAGFSTLSCYSGLSGDLPLSLALIAVLALALLAAMVMTRTICNRRFRPVDFMIWLAASMLVTGMLGVLGLYVASSDPSWARLGQALPRTLTTALTLGVGLYLVNLPFMILGFANPFFRERLEGCLRLKPTAKTDVPSIGK